jgi:hypothetical protein
MKYTLSIFVMVIAVTASSFAAQYYVSNSGLDSNSGTSAATPWKTLAQVNGSTFNAGDAIYLQRGGVWNESLIPPSSGASGNPITFDAYGTGPAPVITAAAPISFVSGSWTYVSSNTWKATMISTIASPTVNMVQFGTMYGRKQPYAGGCTVPIVSKYDWCLTWPYLYVYSPAGTNPVTTYATDGSIVPIVAQASGLAMISIVNTTWLTLQHIKVQNFDYMGVSVSGSSDQLVFANMESDGMTPYGTTPSGFDVDVSSGYGTSIQFLNDDAHLNYDGFKVDAATAVAVTNCRGYANRDTGVKDGTVSGTVVTVSYSHFYGNNVAQLGTDDVWMGVIGSGNIALVCSVTPPAIRICSSAVAPVVTNFQTYPARFSITVDDVGSSPGTETYINTFATAVPPTFTSRGLHFNAAVVPSYTVDWMSVNNWYAAGNEIDSHSWSHQYYSTNTNPQNATPYPNAPAMTIQYTGSGTAATMTIAGSLLTTNVTGASSDNLNINLALNPQTSAPYTALQLYTYLQTLAHYSVQQNTLLWTTNSWPLSRPNTHTTNFLNISNQDIKTAIYGVLYDQTKLEPDEMASSKSAIQTNVPGLSEGFYVYPDARNTSRRDAEIETIKVRMTNLEKIAETNTEGRIRTEGQLQELREGQGEIKTLIQAHDNASRKSHQDK